MSHDQGGNPMKNDQAINLRVDEEYSGPLAAWPLKSTARNLKLSAHASAFLLRPSKSIPV